MRVPKTLMAVALAGALAATQAGAEGEMTQAVKDGWIDGRLEAVYALNRHLNPFRIDTAVENGMVHLTGNVESDIDKDLAGELAKGIDGVVDVRNDLRVEASGNARRDESDPHRTFGSWIDDATTTAAVKTKLIGNSNTSGLQISVETRGDIVTLSGKVASDEERQLAEELAGNTGDVREVRNELVVDNS